MVKKLGISQNWYYYTYKNNYNLIEIEKIVKNTFLNYNIFISNIYMYEYPKLIILKFDLWIYNENHYKLLTNIINYLKSLLVLKYNKNIEFNINFSKDIFNDDQLIGTFVKKNWRKLRLMVKLLNKKNK